MKVTVVLILICFLVYGMISISLLYGVNETFILENFGFSGKNLLSKPYILLTSIFIHKDIEHLISNLFVLLFFGIAVENELGYKKMLLIFFLGAFAGDLLSLLFYSPNVISIGASAGVFALIGFGMIVRPLDISIYPPFFVLPLGLLGVLYAIYNVIGFLTGVGNVSYIAHFGGLFTGLVFATRHEKWKRGLKIILILIVIMILVPIIFLNI